MFSIAANYCFDLLYAPSVTLSTSYSPLGAFHDLQIISFHICPSSFLSLCSLLSTNLLPIILSLPCNHFHCLLPYLPLFLFPVSIPSLPVSLIVLFPAEGYSCLRGYENVRKAYSISSYVNSHFPPEQTHFPASDLPRYTLHFQASTLH